MQQIGSLYELLPVCTNSLFLLILLFCIIVSALLPLPAFICPSPIFTVQCSIFKSQNTDRFILIYFFFSASKSMDRMRIHDDDEPQRSITWSAAGGRSGKVTRVTLTDEIPSRNSSRSPLLFQMY